MAEMVCINQCNTPDWVDIKPTSANIFHTVGLKSNGTVVAVGFILYGRFNVEAGRIFGFPRITRKNEEQREK